MRVARKHVGIARVPVQGTLRLVERDLWQFAPVDAGDELEAIERLFAEREARFSRFLPASELNRVNAARSTRIVVSPPFARTLEHALRAATLTGGLVDPTVGAAIAQAGYDRAFSILEDDRRPAVPTPAGRWRDVSVTGTLVTLPADVVLDLNGVVKGLAVDDALALL